MVDFTVTRDERECLADGSIITSNSFLFLFISFLFFGDLFLSHDEKVKNAYQDKEPTSFGNLGSGTDRPLGKQHPLI